MPKQDITTLREVADVLKDGLKSLQNYNQAIEKSVKSFEAAVEILKNSNEKPIQKRGPGRPRKTEQPQSSSVKKSVITTTSKTREGRGRPSIEEILSEPLTEAFELEFERIKGDIDNFNMWKQEDEDGKTVWKIFNATYLGIIEGFHSSGDSGRYGVTTRVFINPNSHVVPNDLKGHIDTAAVNRIRYVENKNDGLSYIERQKSKIGEQFFNEIMPRVIRNHGKKGSDYGFHLDANIRSDMNRIKTIFDHKVYPSIKDERVHLN